MDFVRPFLLPNSSISAHFQFVPQLGDAQSGRKDLELQLESMVLDLGGRLLNPSETSKYCIYVVRPGYENSPLTELLQNKERNRYAIDVFSNDFIRDCYNDRTLHQLDEYRLGDSSFPPCSYNANEILLQRKSWKDLKPVQGSEMIVKIPLSSMNVCNRARILDKSEDGPPKLEKMVDVDHAPKIKIEPGLETERQHHADGVMGSSMNLELSGYGAGIVGRTQTRTGRESSPEIMIIEERGPLADQRREMTRIELAASPGSIESMNRPLSRSDISLPYRDRDAGSDSESEWNGEPKPSRTHYARKETLALFEFIDEYNRHDFVWQRKAFKKIAQLHFFIRRGRSAHSLFYHYNQTAYRQRHVYLSHDKEMLARFDQAKKTSMRHLPVYVPEPPLNWKPSFERHQ